MLLDRGFTASLNVKNTEFDVMSKFWVLFRGTVLTKTGPTFSLTLNEKAAAPAKFASASPVVGASENAPSSNARV